MQMHAIRLGHCENALTFLQDQGEANKDGKVGFLRHRDIELCPIGPLAVHVFAHFHISNSMSRLPACPRRC